MTKQQIETWAITVLDRVKAGKRIDDTLVQLLPEWPEPVAAARMLAGHANSARGQTILWLIGSGESEGIRQITHRDPALWLPQVDTYFDGAAPDTWALPINFDGVRLVALVSETDRAPYVVKVPGAKPGSDIPHLETPMRSGGKIHTATRTDLLRILVPALKTPEVSLLDCRLLLGRQGPIGNDGLRNYHLHAQFDLYIVPHMKETLVFPNRRNRAWVQFHGPNKPLELGVTGGAGNPGALITPTLTEFIVNGPGQVSVFAQNASSRFSYVANKTVPVHLELVHASGIPSIRIKAELGYDGPKAVTIGTAQFDDSWSLIR